MLPDAPSHRILIVTDAWHPQVNGVVRTLTTVVGELTAMGHIVSVIGPDRFRTLPCPTYLDIALSIFPKRRLIRMIEAFQPEALHIATEGPLGIAARGWALRTGFRFTTAFHTRFAEYLRARTRIPVRPVYAWMRRFHDAGAGTMVATRSLQDELTSRGFSHVRPWSRGVDLDLFKPEPREDWDLPRPLFIYVGRVAVEKEYRRVSRPRFAGLESCCRRRSSAGVAAARLSRGHLHRAAGSGETLWRGPTPAPMCLSSPA